MEQEAQVDAQRNRQFPRVGLSDLLCEDVTDRGRPYKFSTNYEKKIAKKIKE